MGKLTDIQIKAWIKAGTRFEGKSDGNGLYLRYRTTDTSPSWRFRYRFAGKPRVMTIGAYGVISLAKAREITRELAARVSLGYDVAGEKQERKAALKAQLEADQYDKTVSEVAEDYFKKKVLGTWKHPDILRRRLAKDINPRIGQKKVKDVKPRDIDALLQAILKRGAPSIANDVLRWIRRIFDHAIKLGMIEVNPAAAFDMSDAGGKETSRERWLTRQELVQFFEAMRMAKGFSRENELTLKLLLVTCVRKMELCAARWSEFDLANGIWYLPGERTKTGDGIDIPLPKQAIEWLEELRLLSCNSKWVLPARKQQHRMIPHIQESTLPVALAKVKHEMPGVPNFTIHDLRRTARTHLEALGVNPIVAERCLNHRIKGVEGIYNRHQYLNERREALAMLGNLMEALERGEEYNVTPLRQAR
ncbi:tyrosine-type recombinase/integrase [Escherichia coli]|uniref:tyrosine-type recombinase/integrase n=1 Tax=Escherichia coli TaxID=562 RepID=UPI000B4E27C4|nr:site-specific integrase [Escherichia coli]OWR38645.1 integrase [Escherichia coli]